MINADADYRLKYFKNGHKLVQRLNVRTTLQCQCPKTPSCLVSAWDDVSDTEPLAEGRSGELRRAQLRLPGGL